MQAIGFAIIDRYPVCERFRCGIGTARIERRFLALGSLLDLAEHLGRGRLIESCFDAGVAYRLEEPQCPETHYISGVLRYVEADAHMALRADIVYFGWIDFL